MNQRASFIAYFFREISSLRYALLKFIHPGMAALPESSDIDMVIGHEEKGRFLEIIREGSGIEKMHFNKKSFATFISLYFRDGSYLELDLLHRFDRKGILYLDPDEVLDGHILSREGLKLASHHHNFEYIMLFYLLNESSVPQKYRDYFSAFGAEERAVIFTHLTGRYKVNINVLDELYEYKTRFAKKIRTHVSSLSVNRGFRRIFHRVRYVGDVLRDSVCHHGLTVTFSGVDGAGKSTIIDEVKGMLERKYRQKTVVLRHRPSLLPILSTYLHGRKEAEQKTRERLPRQGSNRNVISSFFRFLYYYLDYLVGQYYIYFRYTLRGYTVLYDRYYFDFIIDARRSNIVLPRKFLRWCYHFVFKPQVNVFLFAPAEVIYRRKQEMSESDINQLTSEYKALFEELGRSAKKQHYLVINNTNLQETVQLVMKEYISAAA
ncbi:MAG: hypothetical protein JNL88_01770 [Bacteroidia bacterium]|nr:hypothetical protein [Bacteroidia bacterium]